MVLNVESTCPYAAPHLTVCRSLMRCLSSACLFVTRVQLYGWISHNFAIRINSAKVHVREVKLSSSVFLTHAKALERSTTKYPLKRVICKTFTIPTGFLDVSIEKLFFARLPTRIVTKLVHVESFNGTIQHNSYNFQHFDFNEIAVYLDGQQVQCVRILRPDFANRQYVDTYMSLFNNTNKINRDEGNFVSCKDYARGYSLYVYDLSLDIGENDHFNLIR